MSSMNVVDARVTPAAAYAARASSTARRPAWCQTSGRSAAGSSASAAGTVRFKIRAPWLPPTIKSTAPLRAARAEPLARRRRSL